MIRVARPSVAVLLAALVAGALSGCTPNVTNGAMSWMSGQGEVAQAELVVDRTTMFGTSGVIRGELKPDLDDAALDGLVQRAVDYVRDHEGVEFRLGYADVDFLIEDAANTAVGREHWDELRGLDGLVSALASAGDVLVHTLRPEARATLDALRDFPAPVEFETFRTLQAEESDRRNDDYGPRQNRDGALNVTRGAGCDPTDEQWDRALLTTDDAVESGNVVVCGDYALEYVPESDLVAVATAWAESQASAVDPAPALAVSENDLNGRVIHVTPGDAALFAAVQGFETPGAPEVSYELRADGTLEVSGGAPTSELVAALASSPTASLLTSISVDGSWPGPVGGESVIVRGTLAELAGLIAEVEALFPLDPAFYNITADAGSLRVDLYSPPGSDPDMASAAAALKGSPIWTTRATVVGYLNGEVLIENGVARVAAEYTDHEPYDAFVAAWNAG